MGKTCRLKHFNQVSDAMKLESGLWLLIARENVDISIMQRHT